MEVMVTTGAIRRAKLQSNRCHQQTNTQLFTGQMPFLSPNQQCQSTRKLQWQSEKCKALKKTEQYLTQQFSLHPDYDSHHSDS